jgi:hypothetical protein
VAPKEEVGIHFAALGRSCLLIRETAVETGKVCDLCLLRWDQGRLEVERARVDSTFSRLGGMIAQSRSLPPRSLPLWCAGELGISQRFIQVLEHGTLRILIDRYNHFVVFDSRGNLVCIFSVIRDEAAALLVDGTWWGSRRLIGGESAPGAAERFARALLAAEQVRERT